MSQAEYESIEANSKEGLHIDQILLLSVTGVFGILVLVSYGVTASHYSPLIPKFVDQLWGAVPDVVRICLYVLWALSATGFVWSVIYLAVRVPMSREVLWFRHGRRVLIGVYAALLAAACCWMPISSALLLDWSSPLFAVDVTILSITGTLAGVIPVAIYSCRPKDNPTQFALVLNWVAFAGAMCFFVQTFFVDMIYWSIMFYQRHYPGVM